MQGPEQVRVKRKRNEPAPDTLIVEPQHKRAFTDSEATRLQYVRQKEGTFNVGAAAESAFHPEHLKLKQQQLQEAAVKAAASNEGTPPPSSRDGRRTFHLSRVRASEGVKKKGKGKEGKVATFVEEPTKKALEASRSTTRATGKVVAAAPQATSTPLKRPGRGSAVRQTQDPLLPASGPPDASQQEHMEWIAGDLHQLAMDELVKTPKPKVIAAPKLSAARSRDLHRRRAEIGPPQVAVDQEMADEEDGEYVYETYVLASAGDIAGAGADDVEVQSVLGDVGYLIITDEDQSLWEAYIEDEPSDKDWDTDEEDENAEDYYGADYPEDELASDDEFDRGAYGYRKNAGSDDEEWDEDTGTFSDAEYDRSMNPWKTKTPSQFAKYLERKDGGEDDDD